jgi:N-methylhydantoinase A/oxoprolinase/acetone carboxylase beta subunit
MSTNVARNKSTTKSSKQAIRRALRRGFLYRGINARVARQLGLGKSGRAHVWRVAMGLRNSRRVTDALLAEIERIEEART